MASPNWDRKARATARRLLKKAQETALKKKGPRAPWAVEVHLVGSAKMTALNTLYRGKRYATDILSFPAPRPIRELGMLGELVICTPTLKRQAREQGHTAETELKVLITHGILHLLGFDHEKGPRAATAQARWEQKLLGRAPSLIRR